MLVPPTGLIWVGVAVDAARSGVGVDVDGVNFGTGTEIIPEGSETLGMEKTGVSNPSGSTTNLGDLLIAYVKLPDSYTTTV